MMTDDEKDTIDSIMAEHHNGDIDSMIVFSAKCFDKLPKKHVTQEVTDRYNRLIAYLESKKG